MKQIPLAGVLGNPIAQSKSPRLHSHWLQKYGLLGHYVPLHVTDENLETVVRAMPKMGFVGANVTLPHKIAVMKFADQISDRATLIGAANTLTFKEDGRIFADNTDGYGFMANIRQNAPDWEPKAGPAVILGAGGAARAIIVALADAGVPEIFLTNRTRAKADALRAEFGARIKVIDWVQAGNILEEAATLINSTSLGMTGNADLRVPLDGLRKGTLVTDIVYSPLRTKLLTDAEALGCITVDGLGMLLHQGVPGFERWFGVRPVVDDETRRVVLG
ncbi:MAG: shikimate dehydrogenase [Yoonia sp.]|nr:shikimate dehydrogenase [Yoonia sp.]MDG1862420.1 shikimate dehydrogenase [Yoonia sp.]